MPTILVADDSLADRTLASGLLTKAINCNVIGAPDGDAALSTIKTESPDIILTDLYMPGLNGLQLVTAVKDQFPGIPVVLMTGNGSEDIAAEALRKGAASYVPKRRLAEDLARTVVDILSVVQENRVGTRLMHYVDSWEASFTLHNELSLIQATVSHLQQVLRCLPLGDETERLRVGIALEAALSNAMLHGNLEIGATLGAGNRREYEELFHARCYETPYRDRRVHLTARVSREQAEFVIADEGTGFDVPPPHEGPMTVDSGENVGRGLTLMSTIMDTVTFNAKGNQVTLTKRRLADDDEDADAPE